MQVFGIWYTGRYNSAWNKCVCMSLNLHDFSLVKCYYKLSFGFPLQIDRASVLFVFDSDRVCVGDEMKMNKHTVESNVLRFRKRFRTLATSRVEIPIFS